MTSILTFGCGNPDHFRDNVVLPVRADSFAAEVFRRWRCPTIVRGPSTKEGGKRDEPCGAAIMLLDARTDPATTPPEADHE